MPGSDERVRKNNRKHPFEDHEERGRAVCVWWGRGGGEGRPLKRQRLPKCNVARKISRVTHQFCNLERQQNVALRVARKVEISCVWHVHRNLQRNFVKIGQSGPVFCLQDISSWRKKSCKQFPPGALQVAKKYCERVKLPLQLAMFFSRHRCETSC